jgi:hypothetical protein
MIVIPSLSTLRLICPSVLSKSMMTDNIDHWLWKSRSWSVHSTFTVSQCTFNDSCRLLRRPVPVSKKTLNGFGLPSGIGLSKVKIGWTPTAASLTYLSHEITVKDELMTSPEICSLSLRPSK